MLKIVFISILLLGCLLYILSKPKKHTTPSYPLQPNEIRPVMLIIIDSLMNQTLQKIGREGKTPALSFLIEKGHYYPKVVSAFPTMSVCIDTTLLTGTPPNSHHIFGLTHYRPEIHRVINFGTGMKESIAFGIKNVLHDSLKNMNQKFISKDVETIHEAYPGPTGSINALIFRSKIEHTLRLPLLVKLIGMPTNVTVYGPEIFSYGSLHQLNPNNKYGHPWLRYGMNDRFTAMEITPMIKKEELPPFTILYLPSNDDYLHANGPTETKGIEKADRELQKILDAFPSWEDAINTTTFIILGDSGHTQTLPDHHVSYIDLRKILKSYRIMPTKQIHPREMDQLVCCVNERMSYIYILDDQLPVEDVVNSLQQDERIDLISWKKNKTIHVVSGVTDGEIQYRSGGIYKDTYDQSWDIKGNLTILDLTISDHQQLEYGEYPDALFRLEGVMETSERVVVITCLPGYEITDDYSPTHSGGSHGSLHYQDSDIPMIVTGTDTRPEHLRIIDLKKWILSLLQKNT